MKRMVFVMNIPSPYRIHLLSEMWHQAQERDVEMHVHFMRRGYKHLPPSWMNPKIDFPHTYWKDYGINIYNFNPGLIWKMVFNPPDYMVCGSSFDTITGVLIQLFGRAKTKICWIEGNTKTPGKMDGFIGWFKRLVIGKCKYAAVPGTDAAKYIALHQSRTKMQMPKPVMLPNLVDEMLFRPRSAWPQGEIAALREQLGVAENEKLIITPARLLEVKGLIPYIRLLTPQTMRGWKEIIIGNGPLKEEICTLVKDRGLEKYIKNIETVAYADMPKYYAASDLMLLPSIYDPNPLSVVEALHSGLPIALTSEAGNVEEAVTEGKNGWVLPVKDKERFGEVLRDVFSSSVERLRQMGKISLEKNARFWATEDAIRNYLDVVIGKGDNEQ